MDFNAFLPLLYLALSFFSIFILLFVVDRSYKWKSWFVPCAFFSFLSITIKCLRGAWRQPTRGLVCRYFCVCYDTAFTEKEIVAILVSLITFCFGFWSLPMFAANLGIRVLSINAAAANIVKAITVPISDLVVTFAMFIASLYWFSSLAFEFFSDDLQSLDGDYICSTMFNCFIYVFDVGWRSSDLGGMMQEAKWVKDDGSSNSRELGPRVVYNVAFYVIVGVLLNNIVTGIILDTFAALRESMAERNDELSNKCFITGLTRETFESSGHDFDRYSSFNDKATNHLWNYVFFMYYLEEKDKDEFTGGESYVYDMIHKRKSFKWIPSGISWKLQQRAVVDEEGAEASVEDKLASLDAKLEGMTAEFSIALKATSEKLDGLINDNEQLKKKVAQSNDVALRPKSRSGRASQ